MYIVPSRSAVDYCYLLCALLFIERLSSQPTGPVSNWESSLTTVYSLFTFIKNEFPAFSMQGIYCGPLFRGPQRGVFCILPAVPSFLGSSICIVLRPFRYSHYHDSTEQNIAFHRDQPQDSSPGFVRWHFRPRIYHRSCHHSSEAGP